MSLVPKFFQKIEERMLFLSLFYEVLITLLKTANTLQEKKLHKNILHKHHSMNSKQNFSKTNLTICKMTINSRQVGFILGMH